MAAQGRRRYPALRSELFSDGYRFDFFEAVRLLERLYPERRRVGGSGPPSEEAVRFRTHLALDFAASPVTEIVESPRADRPAEMKVAFMGLAGAVGVLPRHYSELLIERSRRKDFAFLEFLDLFHHRLISLFFRAWAKYRVPVLYERSSADSPNREAISQVLFSLFGMGTGGLQERLDVDDRSLLYYSGLFAQHRRSASALEGLLSDFFEVPVRVSQFVGEWLPLSRAVRTRIGLRRWNSALGVDAVTGRWCWDQQARFRVRIGPLGANQFSSLLPSGSAFRKLVQMIRFFAGQELDFDIQLVLKGEDVPRCRLGRVGELPARLGWCGWIGTRQKERDTEKPQFGGSLTRRGAFPS